MRERLAVAISVAALAVALLGTTSLGEAARKAAERGVDAAGSLRPGSGQKASAPAARGPRGPRGRRGRRGPAGPRGLRGFQGPPGDKGDRGDAGPSNAYGFQWTSQVPITASTPALPTIVAAPSTAFAAGKYAVTAQIAVEGASDGVVSCRGRQGGPPGQPGPYFGQAATSSVGSGVGSVRTTTLTLAFGMDLAQAAPLNIACWETGTTGALAGPGQILVTKVGDLTTIS